MELGGGRTPLAAIIGPAGPIVPQGARRRLAGFVLFKDFALFSRLMSPKHSSRRHPSRRPSKPAPRPGFSSVRSFGSSRMSAPMSSSTWRPAARPGAASAYSLSSVIPVPAAVEPKLNDTQTLEMLALGRRCYSLFGQTRWFWSHLSPSLSAQRWLRFHFLQASMLSWFFIIIYLVLALVGLLVLSVLPIVPFEQVAGLFVIVLALHLLLFAYLGSRAGDGKVPHVPFFGGRAARLAASDTPLSAWKA